MQTLKRRSSSVDLDDNLIRHLDEFGRRTNGCTGNDSTFLGNGGGLDDGDIELVARLVLGIPALRKNDISNCFPKILGIVHL